MPDEVIAHHAKPVALAHAANEAGSLVILAKRENAYALLLDLRPAILSAHGVNGFPAFCGGRPQDLYVAGFSHQLS